MKELNITTGKRTTSREVAEKWDEIPSGLFQTACSYSAKASTGRAADKEAAKLLGIRRRKWMKISPAQRIQIEKECLAFLTEKPECRANKMPTIRAGLLKLEGFSDMLTDVTWEEFIFADTLFTKGKTEEAIAVLWRPKTPCGRMKFSQERLGKNIRRVKKLPAGVKAAAVTAYAAVRRRAVEKKHTHLFGERGKAWFNGKEVKQETKEAKEGKGAGWADAHHTLMGDKAYEERKFLESKATTMLAWLDRRIAQNEETERRMAKMKK